jgi:hypothetical protein
LSDNNRDERLQIMLTQEELAALDDWRFSRRMPSRAAAVRELLRRGLAADGVDLANGRMKSKDYGVTDSPAKADGDGDGQAHDNFGLLSRKPDGSGRGGDGAAS